MLGLWLLRSWGHKEGRRRGMRHERHACSHYAPRPYTPCALPSPSLSHGRGVVCCVTLWSFSPTSRGLANSNFPLGVYSTFLATQPPPHSPATHPSPFPMLSTTTNRSMTCCWWSSMPPGKCWHMCVCVCVCVRVWWLSEEDEREGEEKGGQALALSSWQGMRHERHTCSPYAPTHHIHLVSPF